MLYAHKAFLNKIITYKKKMLADSVWNLIGWYTQASFIKFKVNMHLLYQINELHDTFKSFLPQDFTLVNSREWNE